MKSRHSSIFHLLLLTVAFFAAASSLFAEDTAPVIMHETDSGSAVELTVGQTVEFSLAENIPNTSSWTPYIPWCDTANSIEQTGSIFDVDQTTSPVQNFFYSAKKEGQTMLVFYKDGVTSSGIPNNIVQHALVFIVHVNR